MATELSRNAVIKTYARWAPVYDVVFGSVFENARRMAVEASERVGGRILEVGVGTGISLPYYLPLGAIFLPTALDDPYVSRTQSHDLRVIESTVDPRYDATSDRSRGSADPTVSSSLACGTSSGRSKSASAKLKIAQFAPMPTASDTTDTNVKAGFFASIRQP